MEMIKMFEKCLEIATDAHNGQKRWNGDNYIIHPLAVADKFKIERLKCIAILHDVIEDSNYDRQLLSAKGIRGDITAAVEIISLSFIIKTETRRSSRFNHLQETSIFDASKKIPEEKRNFKTLF